MSSPLAIVYECGSTTQARLPKDHVLEPATRHKTELLQDLTCLAYFYNFSIHFCKSKLTVTQTLSIPSKT